MAIIVEERKVLEAIAEVKGDGKVTDSKKRVLKKKCDDIVITYEKSSKHSLAFDSFKLLRCKLIYENHSNFPKLGKCPRVGHGGGGGWGVTLRSHNQNVGQSFKTLK